MTGLNIRDEPPIHESLPCRFPGRIDDAIVMNFCILYAKQFIYLEKIKDNKEKNALTIVFLDYLSQFEYKIKNRRNYVFTEIKVSSSTS